ncbi:MAG: type II and III secretion system protein [Balneolaceae bacterium]|nr:type II and III secretion system protein [Balneolaceae bacterium]
MKKAIITIAALLFLMATQELYSQDRFPGREYTNPDELIILSEDVSFSAALDIIEELALEFRQKIFVNRGSYEGPIGVEIPSMHWEDALRQITAANNMYIAEFDRYIEIIDVPADERIRDMDERVAERTEPPKVTFRSREIEIQATFFQGDRQMIRELGIDWTSLQNDRVRVSSFAAGSVGQDVFEVEASWTDIFNSGWDINALFSAFEQNNKGEILSSPTIKVLEGELGTIQVGQDFSIKQRDFAGNITDRFFSTGTILRVEPQIFYHEDTPFIYMTVNAERSTAQPDPISTIVNKQEAATEILMLSGESTVIAGLYETEVSSTRRGIPILKDLPGWFFGLRYLFGYESTESTVQELVVLIKATILPSLEERLADPRRNMPELLRERRELFQQEIDELQEIQID